MQKKSFPIKVWNKMILFVMAVLVIGSLMLNMLFIAPYMMAAPYHAGTTQQVHTDGVCTPNPC